MIHLRGLRSAVPACDHENVDDIGVLLTGNVFKTPGSTKKMRRIHHFLLAAMVACLVTVCLAGPAKKQTFTGEVGDAMCGAKHMEGTPAQCTRSCVSQGSKYALVVGEKIYKLDTSDKTVLALLDQQAGKHATVTGTLDGDTIAVSTAVAAK